MPSLLDILSQQQSPTDAAVQQGLATLPRAAGLTDGTQAPAAAPVAAPAPVDFTPPTDPSAAAPSQDASGGLLGSLTGAVQTAAQDPGTSKGLLDAFADKFQSIGQSLKGLGPAGAQGLLSTGLSILANNNGSQNLGQVLANGGISGLNTYNDLKQQQAVNGFTAQKLAQTAQQQAFQNNIDVAKLNQTGSLGQQRINLDANKPVSVGEYGLFNPQTGKMVAAPDLSGVAASYRDQVNADGSVSSVPMNKYGMPVSGATPTTTKNPNVGPLPSDRLNVVNAANTAAQTAAADLTKTQGYIARLSPTMVDPATGQTVPNKDYTPIIGGVPATVQGFFTNLGGDQTKGQQLRAELEQNVRSTNMSSFRGLGSFSDKDAAALAKGMPSDTASSDNLLQYMQSYGRLQEAKAQQASLSAGYLSAQRGDTSPLQAPTTINGRTYPAGWTYAQVTSGQAPTQQSTQANPLQSMVGKYSNSAIDAAIARKTRGN